jgi:hypothetical protein
MNSRVTVAIIAVLALGLPSASHAIRLPLNNQKLNPTRLLNKAKNEGLQPTKREVRIKDQLEALKKKDYDAFKEALNNRLANSASYQSYLYEVRDGRKSVEKAKILAAYKIYETFRKHWKNLQTTIINEAAEKTFEEFAPYLKHKLEKIRYRAPIGKASSKGYFFTVGGWANVRISKNHRVADVTIDIASRFDSNKVASGVEQVSISRQNYAENKSFRPRRSDDTERKRGFRGLAPSRN